MTTNLISILESGLWGIALFLQSWNLMLYFQQDEYSVNRFVIWYLRKFNKLNKIYLPVILFYAIIALLFSQNSVIYWISSAILASFLSVSAGRAIQKPKKIKMNYTTRLIRLLVTVALFLTGVTVFKEYYLRPAHNILALAMTHIVLFVMMPVIIGICNFVVLPIEKSVQLYYTRIATAKIKAIHPLVIGITGSYGKTSTKEILFHILKDYKKVIATPKSYNTLMGICKVINSSLEQSHDVFIVEMDAYGVGEIKQICDLVSPSIGVVTAVGPQHLERFGKMEDILNANYELISSLPPNGVSILNANDDSTPNYLSRRNIKTLLVGTELLNDVFLSAKDVKMTNNGLVFTVVNNSTGESRVVETQLIGGHNILNILMAFSVAIELGLSMKAIAERIKTIEPIPHRLQLIRLDGGVTIIDDAYNSNPIGASYALDALGLFNGRKILVTPGMVELGSVENDENYILGVKAASICDLVILVGKSQTQFIKMGLIDSNFKEENILILNDILDAISYLNANLWSNDTIMYLNDLPDLYSEN